MGEYTYMLLRTILALGLVVALMVGGMYALRSFSGRAGERGRAGIRVIARSFLGQKSSIAIIEVAGEVLVIGISANSVNLLTRLDDEDVIRRLREGGSGQASGGGLLGGVLGIMGRARR